jgi:cytochrome c peroxidase
MRDTSCATCHRMDAATADGLSLSVGAGAITTDGVRTPGEESPFTIRNAPDLFNRGHADWKTMFWDTRMEALDDGRFVVHDRFPGYAPGNYFRVLPDHLDNILAAQALFPMTSRREMRGPPGSYDIYGQPNELGGISDMDVESIWFALMRRLRAIEGYRELMTEAYPERTPEQVTIFDLANALAAFIIDSFSFTDAPWDRFIAGSTEALSDEALKGALLFFGEANCVQCHGGTLLTDQGLYNVAVPPMTRGPSPLGHVDLGAAHRSHAGADQHFFFRTPPLRNVALTAPYFHNGSAPTLASVLKHKSDVHAGLWDYDPTVLPPEFESQVHRDPEVLQAVEQTISPAVYLVPALDAPDMEALIAFLESLTSPRARELEYLVPEATPSGLPLNLP